MQIVKYGDPVLRQKGTDVDKSYPDLKKFANDMFDICRWYRGIGLAAHQVGIPINMFVLDTKVTPLIDGKGVLMPELHQVYINPKIESVGEKKVKFKEGCLSIPGIYDMVERDYAINVSYYDEDFVFHNKLLMDIHAIAFQHEFDHINGILFIDRVSSISRKIMAKKLQKIHK